MKFILITILLFNTAKAQDYVANWITTKENGVINYQLQKSTDSLNWITIATLYPKKRSDTNKYSYKLPVANNFYRVKTLFSKSTVYTSGKKVVNTNVVITNAVLKINTGSDNLTFTATNEAAVSYYSIERQNSSSSAWVVVGKLMQTDKKNYTVNITKVGSSRRYKLIAVYKTKIVSQYISFVQ